ncbi:uncharacterized protein LOC130625670 isoform X2 [Hydractinia symbiolongicarpus]|uniref:uncharacterized protein LOC130625670 isoform X2 n=1 Tax=Hydractinia symbiolongicarpus TaxID=13093 RepID=UPI00254AF5AB|nr:uncharacterized protein LOC130625670 isoform X2 [Hydractinia symbiolongicarpus]
MLIRILDLELFDKGFRGEVIVSASEFPCMPYITEISKTTSTRRNRTHFTIDFETLADTKNRLDTLSNKNVVYNKGLTACSPISPVTKYQSRIAAMNKHAGVFGMTYTWSVDRSYTLEWYSNYFTGIITNYPGLLAKVVKDKKIRLATHSDKIPAATSSTPLTNTDKYESCNCDYYPGGCKIEKAAPKGYACQCTYQGAWTCHGWVVLCSDKDSRKCRFPDTSIESCREGRGDCGAY